MSVSSAAIKLRPRPIAKSAISEIDQAAQGKDEKKAEALTQKINDLEKQVGPEYVALFNALYRADPNTKEFQDVLSMFERLDESCRH